MTLNEVRTKYLEFMQERGHAVTPSASIVPENDPTTLFTGSGMQPIIPYLLGQSHPKGTRITDSQKCFRSQDIEEVGDNRHTTFFEMLGNWSLGDYFKEEQLSGVFEFLTKEIGIDPNKLYVSTFIGDEQKNLPRDAESVDIWKRLFKTVGIEALNADMGSEADGYVRGMKTGERIFAYDSKKNWWSRAGIPENMPVGEPGGGDSEIFYEFTDVEHDPKWGEHCHPNCDCGRFLEIGNSVFMEYVKNEDGSFSKLPQRNVDFGGGLERIAAASINNSDVFMIDALSGVIQKIIERSNTNTDDLVIDYLDPKYQKSFRIIADHVRGAVFMLGEGIRPGNSEQPYFLRRLIRRAIQHFDRLAPNQENNLAWVAREVIAYYGTTYGYLNEKENDIITELENEERRFQTTLSHGMKEFEKVSGSNISRTDAFTLFTTYGFPLELTLELAAERGISVDIASFEAEMAKHQDLSRSGSEQKFKGGLADTSEATVKLHTAHHLLLAALQEILGEHVKQRGSNITGERLRIDFSHGEKMTPEQIAEAERIVNAKIEEGLPVIRTVMPKEEAEKLGAEHEFGAKYPDMVSVYSIGPTAASDAEPNFADSFSLEFCGGPHVLNTKDLGTFKIMKEEAVAAGIRRIKASLS